MRKAISIPIFMIFLAGGLAPLGALAADGSFDKTLRVTGAVNLDVRTGAGSITVRRGSADTVRIIGRIRAQNSGWFSSDAAERVRRLETNPPIAQSGNSIVVGEIKERDLRNNVSISYEILTPGDTAFHGHSGAGNQAIDSLRGPVDVDNGAGNLTLANIDDRVSASTGAGDVTLNKIAGPVHVNTGAGDIRALDIAAGLDARTGIGDVRAATDSRGDVEIHTGSGDIEVAGLQGAFRAHTGSGDVAASGLPNASWKIDVGSGDIDLRVPATAAFDLQAHSSSGDITVDHPLTLQGVVKRNRLEGKVMGGGPLVALSSGSGDIQIR